MKKIEHIHVRQLQKADIESISRAFTFPWTSYEKNIEKWTRYYEEQEKHLRTCLLVEYNNAIVGYGSLIYQSACSNFKNAGIPEINDLWIAEAHRKSGLGSMLIHALEKQAQSQGYSSIGIGVGLYADYGAAQRLYVKLGYIPDGKGITYKNNPVVPGETYPIDDDCVLWFTKQLTQTYFE